MKTINKNYLTYIIYNKLLNLYYIKNEGSFLNDAHKTLKADFILANPPFNDSDWRGELLKDDVREMGVMIDRRHRELTDEEVNKIAGTYHAFRGE